jgi:hypothetical protein
MGFRRILPAPSSLRNRDSSLPAFTICPTGLQHEGHILCWFIQCIPFGYIWATVLASYLTCEWSALSDIKEMTFRVTHHHGPMETERGKECLYQRWRNNRFTVIRLCPESSEVPHTWRLTNTRDSPLSSAPRHPLSRHKTRDN